MTSKTPLRYKPEIDGKVCQQEIKVKHLGMEILGYDDGTDKFDRQRDNDKEQTISLN